VEALEDRLALSTSASLDNGVLTVTGDGARNTVTILQNDSANTIQVTSEDGAEGTFTSSQVQQINVNLHGGDDFLEWRLVKGTDLQYAKAAAIDLGAGMDQAFLTFGGGVGGAGAVRADLDIDVYGGSEADDLFAAFGPKTGGRLDLYADMGGGNDEAYADMWGDMTAGAQVRFDLFGGADHDTVASGNVFDSATGLWNDVDIAAGASLTLNLSGGTGTDSVTATYKGRLDGNLGLTANGDAGDDTVTARILLQAGGRGTFTGKVNGGSDFIRDSLVFDLNDRSGGAAINAEVNPGLLGQDTVAATPGIVRILPSYTVPRRITPITPPWRVIW
jgi:hypothetical protein